MTANRLFDDIIQSFIRWSPPSYNWWHSRQNSIMVYRFVLQRSYWSYPVLPRSMYFEYLLRNCLPTTAIGASPSCYLPIAMGGEGRRGFIYWCKCHICAIKKKNNRKAGCLPDAVAHDFSWFPFLCKNIRMYVTARNSTRIRTQFSEYLFRAAVNYFTVRTIKNVGNTQSINRFLEKQNRLLSEFLE